MTWGRRVLRDPAWCFLAVGSLVGALLFVIMPPFTGIDEIGHFARTYQISEGTLLPQESIYHDAIRKGSGACLPVDVVRASPANATGEGCGETGKLGVSARGLLPLHRE